MQPDAVVGFGAIGQQRIVGVLSTAASETTSGRRVRWIAVQPFDDAAGKGLGFRLRTRQAAIELNDPLPASYDCEPLPAAPAESDSVCSRYFDDAIFRHVHGAAVDQIKC